MVSNVEVLRLDKHQHFKTIMNVKHQLRMHTKGTCIHKILDNLFKFW